MLVGLCIVRLKAMLLTSRTTVNRIGLKPYGMPGEDVDNNTRLETLTIIRPGNSFSFRPMSPAYSTVSAVAGLYDCALLLILSRLTQKSDFSESSFLFPSAVRSLRAKEKNLHQVGRYAGSSIRERRFRVMSFPYLALMIRRQNYFMARRYATLRPLEMQTDVKDKANYKPAL